MSLAELETVKNKVCCGCGGKLDYIDTVDNSGNPTKRLGCNHCSRFTSGVTKEQFSIARELVNTQISVPYSYNVVSDDRIDWLEAQTSGNSRLAHYITEKVDQAITSTKQEMVEELEQIRKECYFIFGEDNFRATLPDTTIRRLQFKYSNELQDRKVEE